MGVMVRLMGGMGNQMFQFAAGYSIAKRCNVPLFLDDSFYLNQSQMPNVTPRDYMLDLFRMDSSRVPVSRRCCTVLPRGCLSGKLLRAIFKRMIPRWYVSEYSHEFNSRISALRPPLYLDGYWQSPKYFHDCEGDLRKIFTSAVEFPEQIDTLAMVIKANPDYVAVSVRRGDYVTNPNAAKLHGALGMNYYQNAMSYVRAVISAPRFKIFTDDNEWAHTAFGNAPDVEIVPEDLFGVRFEQKFELMRSCKHHIIANSSYAWWAAWLRHVPPGLTISPRKWFAGRSKTPEDLIPAGWEKI